MIFMGALVGTLLLGPCADIYGRRVIFLLSGSIISFFSVIGMALLSPRNGYHTLLCMIFGIGFGVGGLIVPFDIFAECLPAHHRGQQLLFIEYFWSGGSILVVITAYFELQYNWNCSHLFDTIKFINYFGISICT
jgi:MFS transporter, putative metabolite:H+ symporter